MQPKLARIFRKGLLKASRTTGMFYFVSISFLDIVTHNFINFLDAWIFTSGIDAGVVRQVAAALETVIPSSKVGRAKIVTVGIAPWGVLKRRGDLIGLVRFIKTGRSLH